MKLAGVGDNVVDRYRDLGMMFPGGQALNVAVYARRLGLDAAYVGALGDDRAGRHVLQAIRAEGLDYTRVQVVHGPNAFAEVALVDGNREFLGGDAGVSKFRLSSADLAFVAQFDLIHSSESSYLEDQLGLLASVAPLSFDFSTRRDGAYLEPILPHVTIAEFSLADLDDAGAEAWLASIHQQGPRIVLATRGAADALLFDGERVWRQRSIPAEIVDTLGAGDAFIARVLVGVIRHEPVEVSLAAAADIAATTCASFGAFGHGIEDDRPATSTPARAVVSGSPTASRGI
jgi:fructoselysine 6-kinase